MKKGEKYIYIVLIVILIGVIASGTTYILMKDNNKTEVKENKKEQDNKENAEKPIVKEDGVKLSKIYDLDDKIIEEFEVTLNGKTKNMKIVYTYKFYAGEEYDDIGVTGTFNDILLYINNKINEREFDVTYKKEDLFNKNYIKKNFNENNFQIIKGADNKNYLAIVPNQDVELEFGGVIELYIFNDDLEQIKGNVGAISDCDGNDNMIIAHQETRFFVENNYNPYYRDTFKV